MEDEVYLTVKSIDLLTIDEAQKLPSYIRTITNWWWLQTSGLNCFNAALVDYYGAVSSSGYSVTLESGGVRPALLIENLDELNLPLYTELEIFDMDWIYIGNNKALAKKFLWQGEFDPNFSEYETSEIKQELDAWLKKNKKLSLMRINYVA